jgi:hypothetical protein
MCFFSTCILGLAGDAAYDIAQNRKNSSDDRRKYFFLLPKLFSPNKVTYGHT